MKHKFKIGDKVKVKETHGSCVMFIGNDNCLPYKIESKGSGTVWASEDNVELIKSRQETTEIRQFESGATRDADDHPEKPNYIKALSPIVLREYVKYIGKHREQPDGSKRDWDNWKAGIPIDTYLEGLARHEMAVWLILHGYKSYDNHGEVDLKDSLFGIMFAVNGMLHEILKDEVEKIEE